jgi:hypothetical protein
MAEPAMRGKVEQRNVDSIVSPFVDKFENRWFQRWNNESSYHLAPRGTFN